MLAICYLICGYVVAKMFWGVARVLLGYFYVVAKVFWGLLGHCYVVAEVFWMFSRMLLCSMVWGFARSLLIFNKCGDESYSNFGGRDLNCHAPQLPSLTV